MVDFKHWEDVSEGEQLPPIDFPITLKTLVAGVAGTRDFMPYHHDDSACEPLGIRAMFVNTMFNQAFYGRFATDWCGPESDFRATTLRMTGQLCPGDMAHCEGEVTRKYRDGDDYLVDIDMQTRNHLGVTSMSSATMAMPSREGGPVRPRTSLDKPTMEADADMPAEAQEWLGKESPKMPGAYPVSEAQIMYWADMVEDMNPLYEDTEYARNSRHGGVIAPPMALITWTMGRPGRTGVDRDHPDYRYPDRRPWPPPRTADAEAPAMFTPPGATDTIATNSVQAYGVPLRPNDRVFSTNTLVDCSPLKRTRLGPGYFQTNLTTFYNQKDDIVGTNLFTLLRYGVPESALEGSA